MTLSERITELEAALLEARATIAEHEGRHEIASSIYRKLERKLAADLGWLRELRARRIAMGRVADDERNAPRDMCCCGRQFADGWTRPLQFAEGCPLHPGPCDGDPARDQCRDDVEIVDIESGRVLTTVRSSDSCSGSLTGELGAMCGGCGSCTIAQAEHSGHLVRLVIGPRLQCGAFRLEDCSPAIEDGCDEICDAAEERFGFEPQCPE